MILHAFLELIKRRMARLDHMRAGPVSFGEGGGEPAEVSFSGACPKMKWFCPNIPCFLPENCYMNNSKGAVAPPPSLAPSLVRLWSWCSSIIILWKSALCNYISYAFNFIYLLTVYLLTCSKFYENNFHIQSSIIIARLHVCFYLFYYSYSHSTWFHVFSLTKTYAVINILSRYSLKNYNFHLEVYI